MTTIDFYTRCANRHEVAAKLVAKAWTQHGSVRVLTGDEHETAEFDRLLWVAPAVGFLPHCRLASPVVAETPIIVDHALEHQGPAAVLINLNSVPPPFFSRFERLAEIVGRDDAAAARGRERFRFYRERGYELRTHDLSLRG